MKTKASWYQWDQDDLLLNIWVQPKASHDEIVGPFENELKVRVTAPPVDGKANARLVSFMANTFGVSRSRVEMVWERRGGINDFESGHP